MSGLERVRVTRYVTPLREGGSLPGVVEGEDLGTYVCKFRGAGQGLRVLVAEVVVGEIARRIGLRTPRLVVLDLDPAIARYEADEEVQDLLNASAGDNLGIDFLPGAFGWTDEQRAAVPAEAARVLWLDAFCANVDRSWRDPNLLVWHGDLWVIDHGASLYFHHGWPGGSLEREGAAQRLQLALLARSTGRQVPGIKARASFPRLVGGGRQRAVPACGGVALWGRGMGYG